MPDHRATAIANEFLRLRANDSWPQQMLVQKLVYIANGWTLAITGEALVGEDAEAWDNGPVYRSIWDHIRDYGYGKPYNQLIDPNSGSPFSADLSREEMDIIHHVSRKYGPMGAVRLSEITHRPDTPWTKAFFGKGRNSRLDREAIRDHYVNLAMAGRERSQAADHR
jgi:uncharacterized phage-associated protein